MKLGQLSWTQEADSEYIARIRRQIELMERFRLWAILFSFGMLAIIVWVFFDIIGRAIKFMNGANPAWPILGFLTGAFVGIAFGSMIHTAFQSLFFALGQSRTERLMLRYYDAFNESHSYQKEPLDEDTAE